MRCLLTFLLFATASLLAQTDNFAGTGYPSGADIPAYAAPAPPAWAHVGCNPASTDCLVETNDRIEQAFTTAGHHGAYWTNGPAFANQIVTTTMLVFANATNRALGPACRMSGDTTSGTYYAFLYRHDTSAKFLTLYEVTAGSAAVLDGGSGVWDFTVANADVLELTCSSTNITVRVLRAGVAQTFDGATSHTISGEGSISSGGCGIGSLGGSTGTGQMVDAWSCDYASGRPTTWYVSTAGATTADGSLVDPWSWAYAKLGADGYVRAGDTVYVREGTYAGATQVIDIDGTIGNPITFRRYPGDDMPQLLGTLGNPASAILTLSGDYVYVWGFEITEAAGGRRWDDSLTGEQLEYQQGVLLSGTGSAIINAIIHNTAQGVFQSGTNSIVYGTICIANGWRSTRPSGHCIYTQGVRYRYITDSVILFPFGQCIQGYGTSESAIGQRVDGVTAAQCGKLGDRDEGLSGGFTDEVSAQDTISITGISGSPAVVTVASPHGRAIGDDIKLTGIGGCTSLNNSTGGWKIASASFGASTFVVEHYQTGVDQDCNSAYTTGGTAITGTFVIDSAVTNSRNYQSLTSNGSGMVYGSTHISRSISVTNSYVFGNANQARFHNSYDLTITGNTFVGHAGATQVDGDNFTQAGFPSNTYLTATPSSGKVVYTEVNTYEAGRAFVTIFNYDTADNTYAYDADSFISTGQPYAIVDAQNPLVVVSTGTYDGNSISLPLNLTALIAIKGTFGPTITNVVSDGAGACTMTLSEAMFASGAFALVTSNRIKITGSSNAALNATVWDMSEPTSTTVVPFACAGVGSGTHTGGTATWAGPTDLVHTTNQFNVFLIYVTDDLNTPVQLLNRISISGRTIIDD